MSKPDQLPQNPYFDLDQLTAVFQDAVRAVRLEHARLGRSVCHSRDGQVVWMTPQEVFAQYGLDEFGRPKA